MCIRDSINTMYDVIRETGAVQPVVWNCNWNRMIKNNKDVFDAIGASKVEVVSFCNYPGQSVLKKPYTKNPEDLTRYDFASFFNKSYNEKDWYGWVFREDFMKKAKVVYEFETFYNQSKYLYPAQVDFFRAMGVQTASMWHYSMPRYAPYRNGSHHLSLTSTPGKAAGYTVAGELFKSLPLYHKYDTISPTEKLTDNYMYSYNKDISAYSSKEIYVHAGDMVGEKILEPKKGVKKIIGFGDSSLVSYDGNGMYSLDISEEELNIEIQPNIEQQKPLWGKDFLVSMVTKLDYDTPRAMTLNIQGWSLENSELLKIENNKKVKAAFLNDKVKIVGVEAGGSGIKSGKHAAPLSAGSPGVLHGNRTYIMEDENGQIKNTHSISAGLDYPGVGPEHSWLKDLKRVEYTAVTDDEALDAFFTLTQKEGIIPALETAHALAYAFQLAKKLKNKKILLNLSGRGDKDIDTIAKLKNIKL